jgi:hypothetical chaperone protein
MTAVATSMGLDFGTTNSVVALADGAGGADLLRFKAPAGDSAVFRSALCFWQDDEVKGGLAHEAGPWAIAEFLDFPQGSRFLQSFKSVAANPLFDTANLFEKRLKFEELGQIFLTHLRHHAGAPLRNLPERIVVGRPVRYVGARPDPALARARYEAMFALLGRELHYVYEPIGAAFSFATRLTKPATLLVADFGGGTSDFSLVRVQAPDAAQRCLPLGSAGIGIAGDRFDYRIMDQLVLPMLGKGGSYRSFDKVLDIPDGHFADFGDWSRLALMRNRRKLEELARLHHSAVDQAAIARMIAVVEKELGYPLYEAVGQLKRALSTQDEAEFAFDSPDLSIKSQVTRKDFESWIAPDLERIGETVDEALAQAGLRADEVDHVFLTGGSSLIPAVRALFVQRFGEGKIDSGEELTSIAHGLALIGGEEHLAAWTADEESAA